MQSVPLCEPAMYAEQEPFAAGHKAIWFVPQALGNCCQTRTPSIELSVLGGFGAGGCCCCLVCGVLGVFLIVCLVCALGGGFGPYCIQRSWWIPWQGKFGSHFYFHQQLCKFSLACHHSSHLPGEELAQCVKRVKALQNLPWLSALNYLKLLTSRMA